MTINATDVQLQQPQVMTDNADGGGQMTGIEIVDGQLNNLFPNISRLDRTTGRVNLRKAFLHVNTQNTDVLLGAHAIITQPPADPLVHLTLFDTGAPGDNSDQRSAAASFIEKYVVEGPISDFRLWDTQVSGQRAILVFADTDVPGPQVGTVFCLSVEANGYPAHQEYVRVTSVDAASRTVIAPNGKPITRNLFTLGINVPLDQDYPGEDISTFDPIQACKTKVRTTTVADAANYYGIANLATAVVPGNNTLQVGSIYGQIVPSTTQETPLLNQPPAGSTQAVVAAGPVINTPFSFYYLSAFTIFLGSPIAPGSVSMVLEGATYVDQGGLITSQQSSLWSGTVDYAGSQINITRSTGSNSVNSTITWQPAGVMQQAPYTQLQAVTEATRRYNYTFTAQPSPAPGTITVSYRALGRWYVLSDDGRGGLSGNIPNTGSGTVEYASGNILATLGALPDVGTSVLLAYGQVQSFTIQAGTVNVTNPVITGATTGGKSIKPGSLSITWNDGTARTATESGNGTFTGNAAGAINYAAGTFTFSPNNLPAPGTVYTVTYQTGAITPQSVSSTVTTGTLSATLPNTPLEPGTVSMSVAFTPGAAPVSTFFFGAVPSAPPPTPNQTVHDDGNGHFVNPFDGTTWGSINYSTGAISLPTIPRGTPSFTVGADVVLGRTSIDQVPASIANVVWAISSTPYNSDTQTITQGDLNIDLTPYIDDQIVGGSVRFTFNGDTIVDRDGTLYRNPSLVDDSAQMVGNINYTTGMATLSTYSIGAGNISVQGLLTRFGSNAGVDVMFRTNGSPLGTASLIVNGAFMDGANISVSADANGNLSATDITGTVDVSTGIVTLKFGHLAGDGVTWVPRPILYDAIAYNAVILGFLPLDATTLGLDPTRLPEDGRVPIFRVGDVVVIHNTKTEALPAPLTAGQQVTLSRQPISKLTIYDDTTPTAKVVDPSLYTADLTTGVITFASPLDLSAYQQPLQAESRIEDMRVLTDVQIEGLLTLSAGVAFSFDTNTLVSSALLFGDLGSVVQNVFTQQTWTNVFQDTRIGNDSIAKYNDVLYPILVDNADAITEMWAIIFTDNAGNFEVLGSVVGIIATGNITTDCTPLNPQTGRPYFTIHAAGWGTGWVSNNVLRFDTVSAAHALWIARSIEAGSATETNDSGRIEGRGDAN